MVTTLSLPLVKGSQLRNQGPMPPGMPLHPTQQPGLGPVEQASMFLAVACGSNRMSHVHRDFLLLKGHPWQHDLPVVSVLTATGASQLGGGGERGRQRGNLCFFASTCICVCTVAAVIMPLMEILPRIATLN